MMGGSKCHPFMHRMNIMLKRKHFNRKGLKRIFRLIYELPGGRHGGVNMIEVTRLNDTKLIINAELIEKIEETPDTIITLTSGSKIVVKESGQEVKNLVILYKKDIYGREL
jgi:flagellar protein FlbD